MIFLNTSFIRKAALFLAVVTLSVSAMALDAANVQRFANQGNASAQFNLGLMYDRGEGVRQDYAKAIEWYTKSANQGDADAQFSLGVIYLKGRGVSPDYPKAAEWYQKAANQGHADAQFSLGLTYHYGMGVRQDNVISKEWFGKSCDNGLQAGCDEYRKLNQK